MRECLAAAEMRMNLWCVRRSQYRKCPKVPDINILDVAEMTHAHVLSLCYGFDCWRILFLQSLKENSVLLHSAYVP